jgi:hypothetical protein
VHLSSTGRTRDVLVSFAISDPFTEMNQSPGISWLNVISISVETFSSVAFILHDSFLIMNARHLPLSSASRIVYLVTGA